jgi:hypothetical protein
MHALHYREVLVIDPAPMFHSWINLGLSSALKLIAEFITAASGVLGLLTNFKKKIPAKPGKKGRAGETEVITPAGKIALLGIALGFCASTALTVREEKEKKQAATEMEHHLANLERPLSNKMGVNIWYRNMSGASTPQINSPRDLPNLGIIAVVKEGSSCSAATVQSADYRLSPEIVADRSAGYGGPPDMDSHEEDTVQEFRNYETEYRAKTAIRNTDDLANAILIFSADEVRGVSKFMPSYISLNVAEGQTLMFRMEDAKEAVSHQFEIVDESAPKVEKPQEHIIHY